MIKRHTVVAILGTTALAFSICTPAHAASFVASESAAIACSADKNATTTPILPKPKASTAS